MIDWYSRNLHSVLSPKREIFGEISKKRTRKRENRTDKPVGRERENTHTTNTKRDAEKWPPFNFAPVYVLRNNLLSTETSVVLGK